MENLMITLGGFALIATFQVGAWLFGADSRDLDDRGVFYDRAP